jgi:hypothetical protein
MRLQHSQVRDLPPQPAKTLIGFALRFVFGLFCRELARIMQCAPKARITSGGRIHPERCR